MRFIEKCLFNYGKFVGNHPTPFIILPIIATLISMLGFLNFKLHRNIWDLYSPRGLLHHHEASVASEARFDVVSGDGYYQSRLLFTRPAGNHSLMTDHYLNIIHKFNDIIERSTVLTTNNSLIPYVDQCDDFCHDKNNDIMLVLRLLVRRSAFDPNYEFRYPTAIANKRNVFLGYNIGQVDLIKPNISHDMSPLSEIKDFRMLLLTYAVRSTDKRGEDDIAAESFEVYINDMVHQFNSNDSGVHCALTSPITEVNAQLDVMLRTLPVIVLTVMGIGGFMLLTLTGSVASESQHMEASLGLIGPAMASVTTFGLLFAAGYPFTTILSIVPFLILAIGVDDSFLIMSGLRHADKSKSVPHQLGMAMSKSGASITITSLTDVLCFVTGIFSTLPAAEVFSTYAAISLAIDYVYQLTFYIALVSIVTEKKQRKLEIPKEDTNVRQRFDLWSRLSFKGSQDSRIIPITVNKSRVQTENGTGYGIPAEHQIAVSPQPVAENPRIMAKVQKKCHKWLHSYMKLIHDSTLVKCLILSSYALHVVASLYFCASAREDFRVQRLYLDGSVSQVVNAQMEDFLLNESYTVAYVVRNVSGMISVEGELEQTTINKRKNRDRFMEFVHQLETQPIGSYGPAATRIWMRPYEVGNFFDEDDSYYWSAGAIQDSVTQERSAIEPYWFTFESHNGTTTMTAFWFTCTYHGMSGLKDFREMQDRRREITGNAEFADYDTHGYHEFDVVADASRVIAEKLLQTTGFAVALMSILIFIFVRDIKASFWVIQVMFSICIATIGYIQPTGTDIDGVSLLAILVTVGVSVDYTSHICYHYFTTEMPLKYDRWGRPFITYSESINRLMCTYVEAGWPTFQGMVTSAVGMFPLIIVPSYILLTFWKVIQLATLLGFYHAIVILPCVFVMFDGTVVLADDTEELVVDTHARNVSSDYSQQSTLRYAEVAMGRGEPLTIADDSGNCVAKI